jgi:hypothetical protein
VPAAATAVDVGISSVMLAFLLRPISPDCLHSCIRCCVLQLFLLYIRTRPFSEIIIPM